MKKKDRLGIVGFSRTIELESLISKLNNTTIGTLQNQIDTLSSDLTAAQNQIVSLTSGFDDHHHDYEDDNGTETINKTTSTPSA